VKSRLYGSGLTLAMMGWCQMEEGLFYWATSDSRLWPTLDWGAAITLQVLLLAVAIGMI
jgi:hypothetical protein